MEPMQDRGMEIGPPDSETFRHRYGVISGERLAVGTELLGGVTFGFESDFSFRNHD